MSGQPKEKVFGDDGMEIQEDQPEQEQPEIADPDENQDPDPDPVSEAAPPAQHKYRIGDKTFATQAEALTYAESQVQPASEVDAYRQVLREVITQTPRQDTVTPAPKASEIDTEEMYTNPQAFVNKLRTSIKSEVFAEAQQNQASRDADERIWSEFSVRHPDLADFRMQITDLVTRNQPEVQAVIKTKGQNAGYDYVATKFKVEAERLMTALKPKRILNNNRTVAPGGRQVENVTPKQVPKKALSMREQIMKIKRG